jgi:hypothetical protein
MPISVDEVVDRFQRVHVDWWIAGGVAIDRFLDWVTRPHDDIDVEMFRRDREVLFTVFAGWDLHVVSEGSLIPWRSGDALADSVFGVWGRPTVDSPWAVEVMLADGDGDTWRFRRDPSISLPRGRVVRTSRDGVPYCTPEVQLLYKAKRARPKDDVDLARCLHRLTVAQKQWLSDALARDVHGPTPEQHPWRAVLASSTRVNVQPD